jgi:membrane fusion protein (multidrug efflux system)
MSANSIKNSMRLTFLLALLSLSAAGCDTRRKTPLKVHHKIVATSPRVKDVTITQQYGCQIQAQRYIKIRASERGYVEQVPVKEGQKVKEGDVIFKIKPVVSQATLDAENAEVKVAELKFNEAKKLFEDKAASASEVVLREANLAKAKAHARLAAAKLDLATIKAPFEGIIQRLKQPGSLVEEGEDLTTLSDDSSIWAYFSVPEVRYFEFMAELNQHKERLDIELVLANGTKFRQTGKFGAIVADFDHETGTIPFRADFPNPDHLLRHGQTGSVLIHQVLKDALVIPQRAVVNLLDKRYVYVVDKDDIVHQREIVIQNEIDHALFVIQKGVGVNDKIVLEGVMQIQDGEEIEYEDHQADHQAEPDVAPPK